MSRFALLLLLALSSVASAQYPIVAVRSERLGDEELVLFSDVFRPTAHPPSDLVIIEDGVEEVLVSGNGTDAILDPKTLDGVNVYFVRIPNCDEVNTQRDDLPVAGADIYSINIETRVETRWTDQTEDRLVNFPDTEYRYGVFNMGPQPLPDGRLVFTSSRRRIAATKNFTAPCLQLYVRHPDGTVECIGPMSQGSALHPELLRDGRLAFSSYESMGLRDKRIWSLWQIHPDGTNWGPLVSAYGVSAFHFHSQRTSGEIVTMEYYNSFNNGFGTLLGLDEFPTFLPPENDLQVASGLYNGKLLYTTYPFAPTGFRSLTPWSHPKDRSAYTDADGNYFGKVTHPSAAPSNHVLLTYSPGPATQRTRPERYPVEHCEIRRLNGEVSALPSDLELLWKRDGFNYTQPRALVSFSAIYGTEPVALPNKVDYSKSYGVFGSSDAFQGQWEFGLDSGGQPPSESLVILGTEPNYAKFYGFDDRGNQFPDGTTGWSNGLNERLRILGEYLFDEPDRPDGDYSFRMKLPADIPFTVAIRGTDGRFQTCGQSWKQVRPGYQEINCMGCHNHAGEPVSNLGKYAWEDDYVLPDFTGDWRIPEFNKDVKPILDANCMSCHDGTDQPVLDAVALSKPLQAGKSLLSHRIRGEHGLDQMPLGGTPLTNEEILAIDEWIDCGCLVDEGQGLAFAVYDQVANPNPTPEAIPVSTPPVEPPQCETTQLQARIDELESQLSRIRSILDENN